jgi:hypothetical protein
MGRAKRQGRADTKAEHLPKGKNPRFTVTSLTSKQAGARELYEKIYCARGEMENRYPRNASSICLPTAPRRQRLRPINSGSGSPPLPMCW